jgi:transposase-like protein
MRGRKRSFRDYPPCDRCGNTEHVVGYGRRVNKYGSKQTFYCKKCNHKFTPDDGFKGRRFLPEIIKTAVQLSQNGSTLKEVVQEIEDQYDVKVGESTVHDWTRTYRELAEKHSDISDI